jgi:6-phosphogluconate dehydrogenase
VPIPTIDTAVAMRDLSGDVEQREQAGAIYSGVETALGGDDTLTTQLEQALFVAMIVVYAQGFALLAVASNAYNYQLKLEAIAKVWRGGCIIRSALLQTICDAFARKPDLANLLLDSTLAQQIIPHQASLRQVVAQGAKLGIPLPGFMSALSYFDAFRSSWSPANLIQAQRDYFGAHTYERVDRSGSFHTEWEG